MQDGLFVRKINIKVGSQSKNWALLFIVARVRAQAGRLVRWLLESVKTSGTGLELIAAVLHMR